MPNKKKPTQKKSLTRIDFCQRIRDQIAVVQAEIEALESIPPRERNEEINARLRSLRSLLRALQTALARCVTVPPLQGVK
jgi:hypothetical protein